MKIKNFVAVFIATCLGCNNQTSNLETQIVAANTAVNAINNLYTEKTPSVSRAVTNQVYIDASIAYDAFEKAIESLDKPMHAGGSGAGISDDTKSKISKSLQSLSNDLKNTESGKSLFVKINQRKIDKDYIQSKISDQEASEIIILAIQMSPDVSGEIETIINSDDVSLKDCKIALSNFKKSLDKLKEDLNIK